MSVLLFGVSHQSAPVPVLEKIAITDTDRPKFLETLLRSPNIAEAMVVSTCNRVEVYAVVDAFHGALTAVGEALAQHSDLSMGDLTSHAYVRYSEAAVEHLFTVASGLDSMVVGEQQIIGQVRSAYAAADAQQAAGRVLHELAQQALRVGKRVHAETDIDRVGPTVVSEALALATGHVGDLAGKSAVVLGAGAMGGLSVAALRASNIGRLTVVNRTFARAEHLAANAASQGLDASARPFDEIADAIADADILVSCTGSIGEVVTAADIADRAARTLAICDLGMPRDVDAAVGEIDHVHVVDMAALQRERGSLSSNLNASAAKEIVASELAAYLASQRLAEVTPTVTALRQRAAEVVEAELLRLDSRLPGLDDPQRDEVARTVRRVVDKLLHAPTVRVKQLAAAPGGSSYAEALRELFELAPGAVDAVASTNEIASMALEFNNSTSKDGRITQ